MVTFNPKDPNTFATASLDGKIKVWGITSSTAYFTLDGHTKGVNYVDYYLGADKPYLVSGADDMYVLGARAVISCRALTRVSLQDS